jgi:hypothetical protein
MRHATVAGCRSSLVENFRAAYFCAQSGMPKQATLERFDEYSVNITTDAGTLIAQRKMIDWAYATWEEHPKWSLPQAEWVASMVLEDIERRVFREQGWTRNSHERAIL